LDFLIDILAQEMSMMIIEINTEENIGMLQ